MFFFFHFCCLWDIFYSIWLLFPFNQLLRKRVIKRKKNKLYNVQKKLVSQSKCKILISFLFIKSIEISWENSLTWLVIICCDCSQGLIFVYLWTHHVFKSNGKMYVLNIEILCNHTKQLETISLNIEQQQTNKKNMNFNFGNISNIFSIQSPLKHSSDFPFSWWVK